VTLLPGIMHSFVVQGKHELNKQSNNTSGLHIYMNWYTVFVPDVQSVKSAKVIHKKYGHLPSKETEAEPWERLCVDLIGPYTIKHKGAEPL
jgi:hypothetical protein